MIEGTKISALNEALAAAATDVFAIVTNPTTTPESKHIEVQNFFKSLGVGGDANGDIYYRAAGVLARLPKGSEGQVLKILSGLPAWTTPASGVEAHKTSHATGGSDALSPADIGASASDHNHTGTYAPAANGVTNGDSHNHVGGDGAQIDHTDLANKGTNTHSQIDSHIGSTSNPHSVTKAQVGLTNVTDDSQVKRSEMGAVSGVATLGSDGKVPSAQLPALAITETFVVASEAAMLALSTAEVGDVAVRSDVSKTYILQTADPSVVGHWVELATPPSAVTSVAGKTGNVSLAAADVGLGNVTNNAQIKKIISAVDGNILVFDGTGGADVKDSGSKPADFATAGHDHTGVYSPVGHDHGGVYEPVDATILRTTSTHTLTNKRITARVGNVASSATPTINTDDYDAFKITALAEAITSMTTNLSGTPTDFQKLIIRIKDDGTARAIAWGASFEAKGVALPTTTVISKALTVGFIYDSVTSKWGCVASAQEA